MALTSELVTEFRGYLAEIGTAAVVDLRALLQGVDFADRAAVRRIVGPMFPELVQVYGQASGALGSVLFEAMADSMNGAQPAMRIGEYNLEEARARSDWATGVANPAGMLALILDELVKQPARDSIMQSAHASGGGFIRQARPEACAFCRMLASRGAVYATEASAQFVQGRGVDLSGPVGKLQRKRPRGSRAIGEKFHGDCYCLPVFVRNAGDYPEGYDPKQYLSEYLDTAPKGTLKETLAEMRAKTGAR